MAALTTDSFRNWIGEVVRVLDSLCLHAWISRMAKDATLRDRTTEVYVILDVISRRHPPPFLLAVPGYRQLGDDSVSMMPKVGAGVVPRPGDVADFLFVNINRLLLTVQEISPLNEFSILAQHRVIEARLRMVESVVLGIIFNDFGVGGTQPGASHSELLESVVDLPMTGSASLFTGITIGERRRFVAR